MSQQPQFIIIETDKVRDFIPEAVLQVIDELGLDGELIVSVYRSERGGPVSDTRYTLHSFDGAQLQKKVTFTTGDAKTNSTTFVIRRIDATDVAFFEGLFAGFEDAPVPTIYRKSIYHIFDPETMMVLKKWGCVSTQSDSHYSGHNWNRIDTSLFDDPHSVVVFSSDLVDEIPYDSHPESDRIWTIVDGQLQQNWGEWELIIDEILAAKSMAAFRQATGGLDWFTFQRRVAAITGSGFSYREWRDSQTSFKGRTHRFVQDPRQGIKHLINRRSVPEWEDMSKPERDIAIAFGVWSKVDTVYYFSKSQEIRRSTYQGPHDPIPYSLVTYTTARRKLLEAMLRHDHLGLEPNLAIVASQAAAKAAQEAREAEAERLQEKRRAEAEERQNFLNPYRATIREALRAAEDGILSTQDDAQSNVSSWEIRIVNVSKDLTQCMIIVGYNDQHRHTHSVHCTTSFEDFDDAVTKVVEYLKETPLTRLFVSI